MKERKRLHKKFALNKRTVADLTTHEQRRVMAGKVECALVCYASNSAVQQASTVIVNTHTVPMATDPIGWPCYIGEPTR